MNGDVTPAIEFSHVTVRYGERVALDDVTLRIEPGRYVGVIGPNGSGKSTLLRAALGALPLADGIVRIGGHPPARMRGAFSYVPQNRDVEWSFPLTVEDVVAMGRLRHLSLWRRAGRRDRDVVDWALERVDLSDRRKSLVGALSGGQQQRAFIARALAQEGRILLLDEPLTGVDAGTGELILGLLDDMHRQGCTVLVATHDLNTAADTCDTILLINRKLIAYGPVDETFTQDILRQTFGRHVHVNTAAEGAPHPEVIEHVIHH